MHGNMNREHLITRQDILNIRRQYNIEGIEQHHNDHTSLQAWVEELKSLDYMYNPAYGYFQRTRGSTETGNEGSGEK